MASVTARHERAWDAATGSGQAALGLAPHFGQVIASDFSPDQLRHARTHARIGYIVARAESSALRDACIDLVTAAQALHWLDLGAFFAEVRRVLRPGGTIAVWTYGSPSLDDADADRVLQRYARDVVGPYWPPARAMVDAGYAGIPFPFEERPSPSFTLDARQSLPELLGYARTWSATTRYIKATGIDPVIALEEEMAPVWGLPHRPLPISWPLTLRVGRSGSNH